LLPPMPASSRSVDAHAAQQTASSSTSSPSRNATLLHPTGVEENRVNEAEELPDPPVVVVSPSRTFGGALGYEELQAGAPAPHPHPISEVVESDLEGEDEGVVSVVGFDSPRSATAEMTSSLRGSMRPAGRRDMSTETLDETVSFWGFGDTVRSASSATHSAESPQQSARTVLGETLTLEGGLDGGLTGVLHRLALENFSLDESLTRSVRRVLQIGTVLTGQRLSDDEICALPKVRFEQGEQQNCAICLEAYQKGDFLTALHCNHFFHVDCLARWLRRSTQCPLCRANAPFPDSARQRL